MLSYTIYLCILIYVLRNTQTQRDTNIKCYNKKQTGKSLAFPVLINKIEIYYIYLTFVGKEVSIMGIVRMSSIILWGSTLNSIGTENGWEGGAEANGITVNIPTFTQF